MTLHGHVFHTYQLVTDRLPIMTDSYKMVYAIGKGTIHVTYELGHCITLVDVLFDRGNTTSLLSIAVFMRRGGSFESLHNIMFMEGG